MTRLKQLTMLLLMVASAGVIQAQTYIGAKGGATFSTITGDPVGENYLIGYAGGLVLETKLSDNFSLQFEGLLNRKGFNQKYTEVASSRLPGEDELRTGQVDQDLGIAYAELPILLKYSFRLGNGIIPYAPKKGAVSIDVFAGPYVAYTLFTGYERHRFNRINSLQSTMTNRFNMGTTSIGMLEEFFGALPPDEYADFIESSFPSPTLEENPAIIDGLAMIDVGYVAGIGMSILVGNRGKLTLDARFSQGLFTIDADGGGFFSDYGFEINEEGIPEASISTRDLFNQQFVGFVGYSHRISSKKERYR